MDIRGKRLSRVIAILGIVALIILVASCQNSQKQNDLPLETAQPEHGVTNSHSSPTQSENEVTNSPYLAHSQFSEDVSYPMIAVYLHGRGCYYYISIPDALESAVQDALDMNIALDGIEPNTEVLGQEWHSQNIALPQIFYVHSSESRYTAIVRCKDGRIGLGDIEATAAGTELLSLAEGVMGWNLDVSLGDFSDLVKIEVWFGDSLFFEISDEPQLNAFEGFLQSSIVPDTAKNRQNQVIELRCFTSDDRQFSILADPWHPMLWLPPSTYYIYDKTDSGSSKPLMDILGIEEWPEIGVRDSEYQYPDGFFESFYERFGIVLPR